MAMVLILSYGGCTVYMAALDVEVNFEGKFQFVPWTSLLVMKLNPYTQLMLIN